MGGAKPVIGNAFATGFAILVSQSYPAIAGQFQPNFGNFFGAMLNQALIEQLTEQWNNPGPFEHDCLTRAGLSPHQLASRGIGPYDVRAKQLFEQCRAEKQNAVEPIAYSVRRSTITIRLAGLPRTKNCEPRQQSI